MHGERMNQTYYTGDGMDMNDWGSEHYDSFQPQGQLKRDMYGFNYGPERYNDLDSAGLGPDPEVMAAQEFLGRLNADLDYLEEAGARIRRDMGIFVRRQAMRNRGAALRRATRPDASERDSQESDEVLRDVAQKDITERDSQESGEILSGLVQQEAEAQDSGEVLNDAAQQGAEGLDSQSPDEVLRGAIRQDVSENGPQEASEALQENQDKAEPNTRTAEDDLDQPKE